MRSHFLWAFKGTATDENGRKYQYDVYLRAFEEHFQLEAHIHNCKNEVMYQMQQDIPKTKACIHSNQWQRQASYIRYNPVNNSWAIGVGSPGVHGFFIRLSSEHSQKSKTEKKGSATITHKHYQCMNGFLYLNQDSELFIVSDENQYYSVDASPIATLSTRIFDLSRRSFIG